MISEPLRRDLRHARDLSDHERTHKPSRPDDCDGCRIGKARRKPHYRGRSERTPQQYGDILTIDNVYMQDWMGCGSVNGFTEAFNSFDLYTEWKSCGGHGIKDTEETFNLLNHIKGSDVIKNVYCDNWRSFPPAVKRLGATCELSQPGIHETNGVIERINGDILAGTRATWMFLGLRRTVLLLP